MLLASPAESLRFDEAMCICLNILSTIHFFQEILRHLRRHSIVCCIRYDQCWECFGVYADILSATLVVQKRLPCKLESMVSFAVSSLFCAISTQIELVISRNAVQSKASRKNHVQSLRQLQQNRVDMHNDKYKCMQMCRQRLDRRADFYLKFNATVSEGVIWIAWQSWKLIHSLDEDHGVSSRALKICRRCILLSSLRVSAITNFFPALSMSSHPAQMHSNLAFHFEQEHFILSRGILVSLRKRCLNHQTNT